MKQVCNIGANTLFRNALALVLLLPACGGALRPWSLPGERNDPYQQLEAEGLVVLREGIAALERGEIHNARANFERMTEQVPKDLPTAVWLQEARLAWRTVRSDRFGDFSSDVQGPRADLRDVYREEALEDPTPLSYYLAARMEEDQLSATLLLEKALELDPEMAWAHYGIAYAAALEGDWVATGQGLQRVFEIQPGHLPAVRLFGWLQAQVGDASSAIAAFEAWIEYAQEDPIAGQETLDRVRFDLVLAYTSESMWAAALELLDELDNSSIEVSDRWAASAVAQQGRGKIDLARAAALAGRRADPQALLPAVQNALLVEWWLKDPTQARRAWRDVIGLAASRSDLPAGLQKFRAEIHLQRLEREAAAGQP